MATVKFETSDKPHLTLTECLGSLTITGSDANQVIVEIDGDENELTTRREGEAITLSARRDCYVTCPVEASLTLQQVMGKLRVRGVGGPLAIKSAMGGVSLRDIGPVAVQSAMGDLDARHVAGDLSLGQVKGDVRLRHVEGRLVVEQCAGDLNARDLIGGADVQKTLGDAVINSALTPGREYRVHALGDIKARIPPGGSARCMFEAGGDVRCSLPLSGGEKTPHRITGQLGAGEARVELRANGDVVVRGDEPGPDVEFDIHFGAAFEAHMAEMERRLQERLSGLDEIGVRIGDRMRRQAEKAAERARRHAEKEAERARRHAERAAGRAERRQAGGLRFTWGSPREAARPPAEPVSDEERLAILRMVEQKKITASEAATLLEALEAKG